MEEDDPQRQGPIPPFQRSGGPERRKTLDALADLYLTQSGQKPNGHGGHDPVVDGTLAPRVQVPGHVARLMPKPVNGSAARPIGQAQGVAGLADAVTKTRAGGTNGDRLSNADTSAPAGVAATEQPSSSLFNGRSVEAVFLGNLPGFAGPWLTQYAQFVAGRVGPVGLAQVVEDQVHVTLVTPRAGGWEGAGSFGGADDDAAEQGRGKATPGHAVHWLISASSSKPELAGDLARSIDRWTLLCGGDDAAVVGTYRTLKQLLSGRGVADADTGHGVSIGLMVMGSERQNSLAAAGKLNHTAGSFLSTPVRLIGWQRKMAPVNQQVLGNYTIQGAGVLGQVAGVVAKVDAELARDAAAERETDQTGPYRFPGAAHTPILEDEDDPAGLMPDDDGPEEVDLELGDSPMQNGTPLCLDQDGWVDGYSGLEAGAALAEPADTHGAGGAGVVDEEPAAETAVYTGDAEGVDLAGFLPGGLCTLEAHCPHQPHVRLALDENGRVHLLHAHLAGGGAGDADRASSPGQGLRGKVLELLEVSTWVLDHLSLLRLALPVGQRDRGVGEHVEPALHLFTNQGRQAVELIPGLGHLVSVHLLQRVTVAGKSGWHCTPLN